MPSYAGVAFYVARQGHSTRFWERVTHVSTRHIPYSDNDDTQYGGKGHWEWTGQIYLTSEEAYTTLEAVAGDNTARTLSDFLGDDWAGVRLQKVGAPDRLIKVGAIYCDVEFKRGPS